MRNNEKFNVLLNSCSNPHRIYNALTALAADKPNLDMVLNALQSVLSARDRGGPDDRR